MGMNSFFRTGRILVIVAVVLVLLCMMIWLLYQSHLDDDITDRLAILPTLKAQYDQLSGKISSATRDALIRVDSDNQLELSRKQYRGCIRGEFTKTYGTNRTYRDVLADYDKIFLKLEWEKGGDGDYSGYYTKTAKILLHVVDQSAANFPTGGEKYRTVYQVTLLYADPAIDRCQG